MTVINMPNKSKGTLHSKQGLSSALKYITDPQKTNNCELVSGQNIIIPSNAYDEMLLTREMAILSGKKPRENEIFGYHFVRFCCKVLNLLSNKVE